MDQAAAEELFEDLGRFETGTAPVDAVLRQGRAIRARRRVVGSGALAVGAALAIAIPLAVSRGGSGSGATGAAGSDAKVYAATSSGGRVTVNPATVSHGMGHFSGSVDGKAWSVAFDNKHCDAIASTWFCGYPGPWASPDDFAHLTVAATGPYNYTLLMPRNVARAAVTLQSGEVLSIEAVPFGDTSVALFVLPAGDGVGKLDLFDAHGSELAFSFPFNAASRWSAPGRWYKPGEQPSPALAPVELLRTQTDSGEYVATANVGPSGPCVVTRTPAGSVADCTDFQPITGSLASGTQPPVGRVGANVDHLQLGFTDGTKAPVTIKSIGGYRFYSYSVPKGETLDRITAFDASGKALPVVKAQMTDTGPEWPSPVTTR